MPNSHPVRSRVVTSTFRTALASFAALAFLPSAAHAQSLSLSGSTRSVNFGTVNLCKEHQSNPAPCSKTMTLTYKVTKSGALGAIKVFTSGSENLDFTLAPSSTCTGSVEQGSTCTVNVSFVPALAGGRPGGVEINNPSGKALVQTLIYGNATGPQIGTAYQYVGAARLSPAPNGNPVPTPFGGDGSAQGLALNGRGDIIGVAEDETAYVVKLPPDGSPQTIQKFTFPNDTGPEGGGVAIDGLGNIYLGNEDGVWKYHAGSGSPIATFSGLESLTPGGEYQPTFIAVDGPGDVFVTNNKVVVKYPAGCYVSNCARNLVNVGQVIGMASDIAGDLYLYYFDTSFYPVFGEFPANGGSEKTFTNGPGGGLVIDSVGNLYGLVETSDNYTQIEEIPAGSDISIPLVGVCFECKDNSLIGMAGDLAGNLLITYGDGPSQAVGTDRYSRGRGVNDPINFYSVPVNSSATQELPITNTGNATLVFVPSFSSPSYQIISESPENCETGVDPAATCTLNIKFAPTTTGPHTIQLTLKANGGRDATFILRGDGTK